MASPGRSYPLEEFMAWHRLPAKVLVTSGFSDGNDEEDSLSSGEIITIEEVAAGETVLATDGLGRRHTLPTYTKRLYEILADDSRLDDVTYPTIQHLTRAKPAPDRVRVLDSVDAGDEGTSLYAGDIITIKGKRGASLLVENQFGMDFVLLPDVHCRMSTQLDVGRYTMNQLLERGFPLRVRWVSTGDSQGEGTIHGVSIYRLTGLQDETEVYAKFGEEVVCIPIKTAIQVALLEGSVLPAPRQLKARTSTTSLLTILSNYSNRELRCIGGGKPLFSPRSSFDASTSPAKSDDTSLNLPPTPSPRLSFSNADKSSRIRTSAIHNVVKHQGLQITALERQVLQLTKQRDFWLAKVGEHGPVLDSTFLEMANVSGCNEDIINQVEVLPVLPVLSHTA